MSINKQAVLEHIAKVTNRNASDVGRAVTVEYWKDIVDFTSFRGVDLFANYLRSQGVREIGGTNRLAVPILFSQFQGDSSERTATFCIEGVYGAQFRSRYKSEFNFAPQ